jgi:hypothetical protein
VAAQLSLSETRLDVVPGGAAVVLVTVHNSGAVVDEIWIEPLGDAAEWAAVEPPSLSLFPGTSGTVAVTFRVPDGSGVPPGALPFGLRARCREDMAGTSVEEGELVVAAFSEATLLLSPQVTRGSRRGHAEVVAENKGNSPIELALTGQADDAAVRIEPPVLTVGPGEFAIATATIIPDRSFLRGPDRQLVYSVTSTAEEHPELNATGQMVQSARLPRWALPVAIVLVVLALLLPIAFLGLRAEVKSAAREAAKAEIAKDNPASIGGSGPAATPGAAAGAGAGSGAGSGTGTAGTGGGGATVGPAVGTGAARAIDGRLFLTSSGQQSFPVPDGKTLRVTDIVLQNPAASAGTLRIRRDDQILLEVALENFRSQDFHFVTPLTFTGGQKLVLDGTCPAACSPSALFSATIAG